MAVVFRFIYDGFDFIFNGYNPYEEKIKKIMRTTDRQNLAKDWANVMGDARRAIHKVEKSIPSYDSRQERNSSH